jgi:hypothetical protein
MDAIEALLKEQFPAELTDAPVSGRALLLGSRAAIPPTRRRRRRLPSRWPAAPTAARSGLRPIPLARPPEFVVCPLMREIRAFRYFWRFTHRELEWMVNETGSR